MLTFKEYRKLSYDTSLIGYIEYICNPLKKIIQVPYHIWLCIKYPFLYPRNIKTNLYYNNTKILDFIRNFYFKYHKYVYFETMSDVYEYQNKPYFQIKGSFIDYWDNWWSKFIYQILIFYHNVLLQCIFGIPTTNKYEYLPEGWKKSFGMNMLNDLKCQLQKEKQLLTWRLTKLENCDGVLQLEGDKMSQDIIDIVQKYQLLSTTTCVDCGGKADVISHINQPYCWDCLQKNNLRAKLII